MTTSPRDHTRDGGQPSTASGTKFSPGFQCATQDCFQRTEVRQTAKREVIGQKCMSNTQFKMLAFLRDVRSLQGRLPGAGEVGNDQAPKGLF